MASKYKVIGKKEGWGHSGDSLGKPEYSAGIDIDSVHLAEDILALGLAMNMLQSVDCWNITHSQKESDREFADDMMRSTLALIRTWHRYAQLKMRKKLAP